MARINLLYGIFQKSTTGREPMRTPRMLAALPLAAAAALAGCVAPPKTEPSLYARLGGEPVVKKEVAETIDRSASDPRTSRSFNEGNLQPVTDSIVEQSC